jgi:hypothetical protein
MSDDRTPGAAPAPHAPRPASAVGAGGTAHAEATPATGARAYAEVTQSAPPQSAIGNAPGIPASDSNAGDAAAAAQTPGGGGTASSADRTRWIEALAEGICARRLSAPAIFLFESLRPINFVASQTLHALAPLASLFVDGHRWQEVAMALEDRMTLQKLLDEIEKKERERSSGR